MDMSIRKDPEINQGYIAQRDICVRSTSVDDICAAIIERTGSERQADTL